MAYLWNNRFILFTFCFLLLPDCLLSQQILEFDDFSNINLTQVDSVIRFRRQLDWRGPTGFYAPNGISPDGEPRAPVLMELTHDLVPINGPTGLFGICSRIYRVLHQIEVKPAEECRRHHNSRQAAFGDITEFYHTLMSSRRFNETLEFPLADKFPRFTFRASFMYLASRGSEPALMIEAGSKAKHALCVQSVRCPEPSTTSTTTTTTTATTTSTTVASGKPNKSALFSSSFGSGQKADQETSIQLKAADKRESTEFWDVLMTATEPKSWFIATIALSLLSFLLAVALIATWIYVCRIRRQYHRRRCLGTCRFGCRCSSDIVRQTATGAAVCGPLGLQVQPGFTNTLTPQGNGSIRSGNGYGNSLYAAGTMNSGRWGSNGQKVGNALYVSMGNQDKTALLNAGCATPGCLLEATGGVTSSNAPDTCSGSWSQQNESYRTARLRARNGPQDVLRRSTSEGSSVSGNMGLGNGPKLTSHGSVHQPQLQQQPRPGQPVVFMEGSLPPSMVVSNTNAAPRPPENVQNGIYYPTSQNTYNYSDSGRGSGVSPGFSHSPTRISMRKLNDRNFYPSQLGSNGPESVEEDEAGELLYSGNQMNKHVPNGLTDRYGQYNSGTNNLNILPNRGSEGDLLNITPPSGFYDMNGCSAPDSGFAVNGSVASSLQSGQHRLASPTGFCRQPFIAPLYPIMASPTGQTDWHNGHLNTFNGEMVGNVDPDGDLSTKPRDSEQNKNFPNTNCPPRPLLRSIGPATSSFDKVQFNGDLTPANTALSSNLNNENPLDSKTVINSHAYNTNERML